MIAALLLTLTLFLEQQFFFAVFFRGGLIFTNAVRNWTKSSLFHAGTADSSTTAAQASTTIAAPRPARATRERVDIDRRYP